MTRSRPEDAIGFRSEVRSGDAEAVRDIVASTGFFHDFEVDVAVELVQAHLEQGVSSGYHFVFAEERSRVIGYACFGPVPCTRASFDLYWIAVHLDFQRRGLGYELMSRAESAMTGDLAGSGGTRIPPAERVYIETSSQQKYGPTWAFYEKCGYRQEARLRDFYAPGDDKIIYVKALS